MLWRLFWSFFKIGAFTFGSGYAMLPMIEREVVERKRWFEREDFYNQLSLAQSAPGPVALNTAVFVGYKMRGWIGALVSVLGTVIPCFTIILLIAVFLGGFRDNSYVEAAFKGLRPAVVALIAVPFIRMLKPLRWPMVFLALAVALLIWQTGFSPVWLILAGIVAGVVEVLVKNRRNVQ
ncbi:MAG: chromate transporter [Bacteroidales bacterium]|nr:chromate transporter [Bacteroidales bacterium]